MNELDQLLMDGKWQILHKVFRGLQSWKLPKGDYLEFGVHEGMSFKHAYHLAQKFMHSEMNFYAFDSFEGLPKLSLQEEIKYDHFHEGQFSCTEQQFLNIIEDDNVDLSKVKTIPGFYNQTLNNNLKESLPITHASVVWIDVDLYQSTVPVLDWIKNYLINGTFLIFDDWFSFGANPNAGELRATKEWLSKNDDIKLVEYDNFHTAGKAFLVQVIDQN